MLLSEHRVPREAEEPCVICGGFYKQRRAWKWWDEILAKGRNEKSIRNAFPFSPLPFFLSPSIFGRTAAAITLLYISFFKLTYNCRALRLLDRSPDLRCKGGEYLCQSTWTWKIMVDSKLPYMHSEVWQKGAIWPWWMCTPVPWVKEGKC